MHDIGIDDAALVAILMIVVEILKGLGLNHRFAPLAALLLGMVAGYFFVSADSQGVLAGIVIGLTSVGLYSGTKNVKKGVERE